MSKPPNIFLPALGVTGVVLGAAYGFSMRDYGDDRVAVLVRDPSGIFEVEKRLKKVWGDRLGIVVLDVEQNIFTDANHIACELFNLSRARLLSIGPNSISPAVQPDGTSSFGVRRGHIDEALQRRRRVPVVGKRRVEELVDRFGGFRPEPRQHALAHHLALIAE